MDVTLLRSLLDPAILFFFFGLFAAAIRSNLDIPPAIAKFFSLYLLMSIGFKGGVSLSQTGLNASALAALGAALLMAVLVPAYSYVVLRTRLNAFDAAGVAATYGSVSAVTFIAANSFIEQQGVTPGGYMAVALVLMESPAILMAVLLANFARRSSASAGATVREDISMKNILHEAFTDGAHLLLLGSLAIGMLTGEYGKKVLDPFTGQIQKGILAFFLLEMGLLVGRRFREIERGHRGFITAFGLLAPPVNAALAAVLAHLLGLSLGDAFILCVLAASASYIVVPAVLRHAIPEANAGLYFSMSLVVTFPFNIAVGIPLYFSVLKGVW
jgi:hypothetical protein